MKRFLPSLIFLLSLPSISLAQKCIIIIGVLDDISRQEIENPHFTLIYEDSIEVPVEYKLKESTYVNSPRTYRAHTLTFDYRKGKYTLRAEKEGYEPGSKDFRVVSRRLTAFGLGNLTLKKRRHVELGEATVRATHIKMVMRGDTVVYDAAAFDLAEGSMLDALVEQLPGAELKDGQIRVNGKFIESLLLNGEDFFAGNPQVALENLPAYTVKQIKVYDRAERDAYLKPKGADGKVIGADEHMVMDVQLKKAYATGWMGNVEGGYGLPDDRYLGRAFGLGYRDKARVSAFANLNNIKNTQIGRNGGQWDGGWPQDGELDVKMGGADYYFSRGRAWVAGDVLLTHEEPKVEQKQSAVSFFNSGDVYERQHSVSRERKFHLITTHQLRFTDDNFYFQVIPRLDYLHNDVSRLSRAAQFTANPTEAYRMESLDSLFALGGLRSPFAVSLLNRTGQMQEGPESWLIAGVNASATIKVPDQNDNVKLYAGGEYRRDTERPLTTWSRAFGPQSTAGGTAQNVLQNKNYDARQYHVKAGVSYTYWYAPYREHDTHAFTAQPKFDYARDHHDRANTLWQLEESLTDAAAGQGLILPSTVDPARLALDLNNSYHSALAQDDYAPGVELEYQFLPEEGGLLTDYAIMLDLTQHVRREHLDYEREGLDTTVTRWSGSLEPTVGLEYRDKRPETPTRLTLTYGYSQAMPSLYYQLGTVDDSDPTNVYVNNPGLRRASTHSAKLEFTRFWQATHRNLAVNASFSHTNRAVAQARHYDRQTGVSTWVPENIDGNWNADAAVQYSMPFGRDEAFQFQTATTGAFVHSVDYATDTEELTRSVVDNLRLGEQLGLTYRVNKHTFGLKGSLAWLRSRSERADFDNISAFDVTAGANVLLNLPQEWQIGTDMTLYCRRGYSDATLNTADWVWNASLAKTMLDGKLTLKLDAVDLLDQISNVQHTVNAQGRTETWTNAVRNYAMLHVTYRFHILPKKKAADN